MKKRRLGKSGRMVSAVGLGAMPLSIQGRPDEKSAIAVIHAALDHGMTLIDTADAYCLDDDDFGHNERLIAQALELRGVARSAVLVATKGGVQRPGGSWTVNGHPAYLKAACEKSLKNLGVDCIDLYQLHAPDPRVPFADSVGALADLQAAGKIRHIGLSNVDVDEIELVESIVEVVSVQNRCNLYDRESIENGVLARCTRNGIAFLPYSPVGGHQGHLRLSKNPILQELAARYDASPYQIALAWLLNTSPVVIPIPGASRPSSAIASAAAVRFQLTEGDMALLRSSVVPR